MSRIGLPRRSGVGAPSPDGKGFGPHSPTSPATPNPTGQSPRAAVPVSNARAEASRRNGAKSRGPNTPEGKARSAQNALKHGMRAEKHVVLPDEDAGEFHAVAAALIAELAPVGRCRPCSRGGSRSPPGAWSGPIAWPPERGWGPVPPTRRPRADLFAERSYGADPNPGLAMIRDGNGTRSFETLLRYRGAAMAEFWRALRTLKALQAELAAETGPALAAHTVAPHRKAPAARPPLIHRPRPDEPERGPGPGLEYVLSEPPPRCTLHEPAASWLPKEPEAGTARDPSTSGSRTNPEPHPNIALAGGDESCPSPRPGGGRTNPQPPRIAVR